jgi:26S proteasome regulatory subunit T5
MDHGDTDMGISTEQSGTGLDSADIWGEVVQDDILTPDITSMSPDEINQRVRLIDSEVRVFKSEIQRLNHELASTKEKMKDNTEKIKLNRQLPHLVGNIAELLDAEPEEQEEGAAGGGTWMSTTVAADKAKKSVVLKTTTRQTIFLPVIGLVRPEELKPGMHALKTYSFFFR